MESKFLLQFRAVQLLPQQFKTLFQPAWWLGIPEQTALAGSHQRGSFGWAENRGKKTPIVPEKSITRAVLRSLFQTKCDSTQFSLVELGQRPSSIFYFMMYGTV
jgi:hypothetical protein